ncbi:MULTISPECIES: ATP-dependent nuclease [Paenibacillus]|uniref:AAA+ ATPase domain-containing protein n=1 Tax=Paenibacillus albilobatus TaxID=2716884 RepID=A0A920CBN8_9BACL|nr:MULTISPECIES: AAA family ATPase [Paenibacillus]GIO33610.1 hypothetical protein J2TS6_47510 [Paenibacillus albilobatus]
MEKLLVEINNIKNIKKGVMEIPLEKGVYSIVGINGCGKTTILQALAQTISRHHLGSLKSTDYSSSSSVIFQVGNKRDVWTKSGDMWKADTYPNTMRFNGNYEGSLFYGTRFNDSKAVDELVESGAFKTDEIVEADEYIKDKMSYIIHGDNLHYRNLKRVRNREIARRLNIKNTPYFYEINGELISQYRMSSGECLLVSLLHFVYNSLVRKSLPPNKTILLLIDEIEVALHPTAIKRLLELLQELVQNSESLVVILTSHAPEVIRFIPPDNIFKIENIEGDLSVVNPCYPSYAIREVFDQDGFDFLLLVEDRLAKIIVEKVLRTYSMYSSRLIYVCPVGGWEMVLSLHKELLKSNVLGIGRVVLSILDGDIQEQARNKSTELKKLFLPIESVEKYLYRVLFESPDQKLKKIINDKYFQINSVDRLISIYRSKFASSRPEKPNKEFYKILIDDLKTRGISENSFVNNIAEDIFENVNFEPFAKNLSKMLS